MLILIVVAVVAAIWAVYSMEARATSKRKLMRVAGQGMRAPAVQEESHRKSELSSMDQYQLDNSDILEGMQFQTHLLYRTPIAALLKNGERHDGPHSKAPTTGDYAHGNWRFRTFLSDELDSGNCSSSMGYVEEALGIRFLMMFRAIVEGPGCPQEKILAIHRIPLKAPDVAHIYVKAMNNDAEFPLSFFLEQIEVIPGVGRVSARKLYEAGFCDLAALRVATPESFAAAKITKGLCAKVRAHFAASQA